MSKISVKGAAKEAVRANQVAAKALTVRKKGTTDGSGIGAATVDSFVNFAHKLGVGADNPLTSGTYGFNPITRNRILLEWIHRGSWLGGVAVDLVANDMTRTGIDFTTELRPDDSEMMEQTATSLGIWTALNETVRWGRLYGGCIAVALVDGQDMRTPLRIETVGPNQFKGLLVLDRWMVEPSLEDLVTDLGPHLGLPKYYRVQSNSPALRGVGIHHSRVMVRHVGIDLPYQQRLTENLWGISVLERLYDRMIAFDSASTGAAQLVFKSYLRTLKIEGLREVVAQGGAAMAGLTTYVDMMRRFQGIEGMTMIDAKDEFEGQSHQAFSGMGDIIDKLADQIAGALEIPKTRLFGQSGGGLNGTNDSDMRLYYDSIKQQQVKTLYQGVILTYRMIAASKGVQLPPNFAASFRPLWELSDTDKATVAGQVTTAVTSAMEGSIISAQTAMKELRQSSKITGVFTNITADDIALADETIGPPPGAEGVMPPGGDPQAPGGPPGLPGAPKPPGMKDPNDGNQEVRPEAQAGQVGQVPRRRAQLHDPAPVSGSGNRPDRPGLGAKR